VKAAAEDTTGPASDIMTVDVEDWFHILEVAGGPTRAEWDGLASRVEANTDALLELFDAAGVRATFFVVGWVAARHPALLRRVAEAGHEIGSHSWWHEVIRRHARASLAADLGAARRLLEDVSGRPVTGFRAPGGSITPDTAWAFDVIVEQGYQYDASLCPGTSSHGGFPSPHVGPHRVRCNAGLLDEIPSSTARILGRRVPYAGGGYLRLFPYRLVDACMRADHRAGRPVNVYVHPREIDPDQPRLALPPLRRFKYYVGLRSTRRKLERLLREHRWQPAGEWLAAHAGELADRVLDVRALAARAPLAPSASLPPPPPPHPAAAAR
jgi:polysaccharide deacetylase family protein (PEP-CTERM system associated)